MGVKKTEDGRPKTEVKRRDVGRQKTEDRRKDDSCPPETQFKILMNGGIDISLLYLFSTLNFFLSPADLADLRRSAEGGKILDPPKGRTGFEFEHPPLLRLCLR